MVRIQRPSKKKKQESLARRLFAAGAAGVTVLTGGILGLRSAGAVKPPIAQVRLRTDLAAGAGRAPGAPGAAGTTVAEEARIKAETGRFLSELRRIDAESKQNRSFLARLLNISPAQAEADESSLNAAILALFNDNDNPLALQNAVQGVIASGAFTPDQAAAALRDAGIPASAIQDIATNLGATPEQAATYAQPSYTSSSEADAYVPPPAAAVLPVAPVAPIIPSSVVEPGPAVLPSVPSAARTPEAPPSPPLVIRIDEDRGIAHVAMPVALEESMPPPERTVQTDGGTFIVTPSGAVFDANRNPTPYTVDPNGQVFTQGSAVPVGHIELQSPGIEEAPREVFVPASPSAPAGPQPAAPAPPAPAEPATPLDIPIPTPVAPAGTPVRVDGQVFTVPPSSGFATTPDANDQPQPTQYYVEPERSGETGRVVRYGGPVGEPIGMVIGNAFIPRPEVATPPPVVAALPSPAPAPAPAPVVLSIGGNTYEINPQTFAVTKPASDPNQYAVRRDGTTYIIAAKGPTDTDYRDAYRIDPVSGAATRMDGSPVGRFTAGEGGDFVFTSGGGITPTSTAPTAPTSTAPIGPPASPQPPAPLTLQINGVTYQIDRTNLTVTKPANDPHTYRVAPEPNTQNYLIAVNGVDTYRVTPATRAGEASQVFSVATNQPVSQFEQHGEAFAFTPAVSAPAQPVVPAAAGTQPTVTPGGRELTLRIKDAVYTVKPSGEVISPPADPNRYFFEKTDQGWNVRSGNPATGEVVYVVSAEGELSTPGPRGETVGGFVASDVTVAEYVSGRADYYVRRATKAGQSDAATVRELATKGIEPEKIAAATLKEWNNDALRVVRAASEAGASAEAIRGALEGREVKVRGADGTRTTTAFTVAVEQAVGEASQKAGSERIQGMGAIAGFLRQAGMSAGDTADKLKAAGFMDDPKAVLRVAGYSDDAVSTLARRVPASQVRIVNVEGRWLALYPSDVVRMPAAAKPASVTEDSLYFSEADDSRFFLGSSPLQEKPWREVTDKQAFLLYQVKFQADGLDRSGAIAETFKRAIAGWGSNFEQILRAANLAGLTNVEIIQGLDVADQAARVAGNPTRYLGEGILAAIDLVRDQSADVKEANKQAIITAIRDAALPRERLDELIQYLAPRLNLTEEQLRSELGLTRLEKEGVYTGYEFSTGGQAYVFYGEEPSVNPPILPGVASKRVFLKDSRGKLARGGSVDRIEGTYRGDRRGRPNYDWNVRLGREVIGRLIYQEAQESRSRGIYGYSYAYEERFLVNQTGIVLEKQSQKIAGRLRKQADGTAGISAYRPLPYQGATYYVPAPGTRDMVLDTNFNPLPFEVREDGRVVGLRNRFFGRIVGNQFRPAYTAFVGADAYDIDFDVAAGRGAVYTATGAPTDYAVVRVENNYEVRHANGTVIGTIDGRTRLVLVRDPASGRDQAVGYVRPTDFSQRPTVSFWAAVQQHLAVRGQGAAPTGRFTRQSEFPGETFGEPSAGFGSGAPTSGGFGGGFPLGPVDSRDAFGGSPFDFGGTLSLGPPVLYLDPDLAAAAGIQPGAITETGHLIPITENGALRFEQITAIPFIAAEGGTPVAQVVAQLPAPATAAEVSAELASRGINPGEVNIGLLQDARTPKDPNNAYPANFLAAMESDLSQASRPTNGFIRFEWDNQGRRETWEVPRDASGGPNPRVKINGARSDVETIYDPRTGWTNIVLPSAQQTGPDIAVIGRVLGRVLPSGDFLFTQQPGSGAASRWAYQGRVQGGIGEGEGTLRPSVGETLFGLTDSRDGLSVVTAGDYRPGSESGARGLSIGGEQTRFLVDDVGNVRDTSLSNRIVGRSDVVVGWIDGAEEGGMGLVNITGSDLRTYNVDEFQRFNGAGQGGEDYIPDRVVFLGQMNFAVYPRLSRGVVFEMAEAGPDRWRVSESQTYRVDEATGVVRNTRTGEPVAQLSMGRAYVPGRVGDPGARLAVRSPDSFSGVDALGFMSRIGQGRPTRQAVKRFGSVQVGTGTYYFNLAPWVDSAGNPVDRTPVFTSFDRRGQPQGATEYWFSLGSVELPDGVHQAYLVHQGDNPNIVGLIDRSEESAPGFRGQFSTFVQSSAVLTADGTIRDIATGGVLRGLSEESLLAAASSSWSENQLVRSRGERGRLPTSVIVHGLTVEFTSPSGTSTAPPAAPQGGERTLSPTSVMGLAQTFSFDETLRASLRGSLSLSSVGIPLNVVGFSYEEISSAGRLGVFATQPAYRTVNGRQVVEFKVVKRLMVPATGAPEVEYPDNDFVRYDVASAAITEHVEGYNPKTVAPEGARFILTLPEDALGQRGHKVFSYQKGLLTADKAVAIERDLAQNKTTIDSLIIFAQRQHLLSNAEAERDLSVYLVDSSEPRAPLPAVIWEYASDDRTSVIVAPSSPVLDQPHGLISLAHEFGHHVNFADEEGTHRQFNTLWSSWRVRRADPDRTALQEFVATAKRFVSPERRADVFAASFVSELVHSNFWTRDQVEQAIASKTGEGQDAIRQFSSIADNTDFAIQLHDSPQERMQNMRYAFDFYLRHPELLGGPLTIPQPSTGRIQSRISKTAAAPSPTTANPIASGFVKAGGGAVNPFVEQTPSEHLPQLGFFGVFATSQPAAAAPVLFSGDNVLQASSTDQITFRWAKAPGAESYWYSSDLSKISGTSLYSWVRLDDQSGIADKGDYFELAFPASAFPAGEHWFQVTAGSADNRANWARADTGYPFRFVRLRLSGQSVLKALSGGDFLTFFPVWYTDNEWEKPGINLSGYFELQNQGLEPTRLSSFTVRADSPLGFAVDTDRSSALITMIPIVDGAENWETSIATMVSGDTVTFSFSPAVSIPAGASAQVASDLRLVSSERDRPAIRERVLGNMVTQAFLSAQAEGVSLGTADPVVFRNSLIAPSDYEFGGRGGIRYAELDRQLVLHLLNQRLSAQRVIDYSLNQWLGDFPRAFRASMNVGMPPAEVVRAYQQQGYLRQFVQAALREGVNPTVVLVTLKDAGISLEQLHQLQNYFALRDEEFRPLLEEAGWDASSYFAARVRAPGFHIVNYNLPDIRAEQQYQRIVLKALYVVPRGQQPDPRWREGIEVLMKNTSDFYRREFRNQVEVSYQILPAILESEKALTETNPDNRFDITLKETVRRVFRQTGDRYDPSFSRRNAGEYDVVVMFLEGATELLPSGVQSTGGQGGWFASSRGETARDGLSDGDVYGTALIMSETPTPGAFTRAYEASQANQSLSRLYFVTAHEIGHSFGLPHAWEVVENPGNSNLARGFHNVVGHMMSYSTADLMSDEYFLPDGMVNLVVGGIGVPMPRTYEAAPREPTPFTLEATEDNLITYINQEAAEQGTPDGLILRALLGSGVDPNRIIHAFQTMEGGGFNRLVRAARDAGIETDQVVISLWQYGLTIQQLNDVGIRTGLGYPNIAAILSRYNFIAPSP